MIVDIIIIIIQCHFVPWWVSWIGEIRAFPVTAHLSFAGRGRTGVFMGPGREHVHLCRVERPSLEKTMSDYAPGILHGWLSAALSAVRQPIGKGGARSQSERDGARPNIFFSTRGLQEYFFGSWLSDCSPSEVWLNIFYYLIVYSGLLEYHLGVCWLNQWSKVGLAILELEENVKAK